MLPVTPQGCSHYWPPMLLPLPLPLLPPCRPQTYCFGLAASMGAFLLGAGTKGKRYSMPNSRIMIHQPLGGASGAAVDIEIQVGDEGQYRSAVAWCSLVCPGSV